MPMIVDKLGLDSRLAVLSQKALAPTNERSEALLCDSYGVCPPCVCTHDLWSKADTSFFVAFEPFDILFERWRPYRSSTHYGNPLIYFSCSKTSTLTFFDSKSSIENVKNCFFDHCFDSLNTTNSGNPNNPSWRPDRCSRFALVACRSRSRWCTHSAPGAVASSPELQ